jgi:hypothetical protein
MAAHAYFLLQAVITVGADSAQNPLESIDVGAFKTCIVRIRKLVAPTAGSIQLQQAMHQTESDFSNVGGTISLLNAPGFAPITIVDAMRYLRWTTTGMNGNATFLIEVFCREV